MKRKKTLADEKMLQKPIILQKLIAFNHLVELNTVNRWLAAYAMGFLYFVENIGVSFSFLKFFIGLLAISLVLCYVMAINDCFDVEDDKIKSKLAEKKIVVSEEISFRDALLLSLALLLLGLTISWFVSEIFFTVVLLIVGLSTLYSVPPVRYKRIFPIGTIGESVGAFLPFLSGYAVLGFLDIRSVVMAAFFAVITIYLRFFHESVFHEVDRKTGKVTFAVVYSPKKALNIGRVCLLLGTFELFILFSLAWFSIEFFFLSGLYLLFSLSLLIPFFKLHLPKTIAEKISNSITGHIPSLIASLFQDHVIPLWGFVFLMIAVIFQVV